MLKFGLLLLLGNLLLKCLLGIGLWKMAMEAKSNVSMAEGMPENQDNDIMREPNTGRIFPNVGGEENNIDLRESNRGSEE